MAQRDAFISRLFQLAKKDKDIIFIAVDFGATALDQWRDELPDQFIYAGISEQNAINVAAGLSASGKKVYVYYMAAWSARCFEQIRYSCAIGDNPITILGNGVGLGYSPAGPAHNPTEDIAYMQSLCGIEILSPLTDDVARDLADLSISSRCLRYIRFERSYNKDLERFHYSSEDLSAGFKVLKSKLGSSKKVAILSSGYMLHRALEVANKIENLNVTVIDCFRIKPFSKVLIKDHLAKFDYIITLEEQTLSGGFGSVICSEISDYGIKVSLKKLGLPESYIFENATRDYLIDKNGLSVESICEKTKQFLELVN